MKNKFGYIALCLNILGIIVYSSPMWLIYLFGEAAMFGPMFFISDISTIAYPILVFLLLVSSIFILILSFKNKENIFLRILNRVLLTLGLVMNLLYFYFILTFQGF